MILSIQRGIVAANISAPTPIIVPVVIPANSLLTNDALRITAGIRFFDDATATPTFSAKLKIGDLTVNWMENRLIPTNTNELASFSATIILTAVDADATRDRWNTATINDLTDSDSGSIDLTLEQEITLEIECTVADPDVYATLITFVAERLRQL